MQSLRGSVTSWVNSTSMKHGSYIEPFKKVCFEGFESVALVDFSITAKSTISLIIKYLMVSGL